MGAEIGVERYEARLVESAGQRRGFGERAFLACGFGRIGAQIALPQIGGGERRRQPGEIEQNIGAGSGAILRPPERQPGA